MKFQGDINEYIRIAQDFCSLQDVQISTYELGNYVDNTGNGQKDPVGQIYSTKEIT